MVTRQSPTTSPATPTTQDDSDDSIVVVYRQRDDLPRALRAGDYVLWMTCDPRIEPLMATAAMCICEVVEVEPEYATLRRWERNIDLAGHLWFELDQGAQAWRAPLMECALIGDADAVGAMLQRLDANIALATHPAVKAALDDSTGELIDDLLDMEYLLQEGIALGRDPRWLWRIAQPGQTQPQEGGAK